MRCFVACLYSLLLLQTNWVSAQEIRYSPYEKFDLRKDTYAIVGKVGNRTYTYRTSEEGYFLDAYDDNMQKSASVMLDFFPKQIYQTRFIAYDDKIMVLYQSTEKNKLTQWAALLDDMGRMRQKPINLGAVQTGFFGPTKEYFLSAVSDDKKQILVYSCGSKKGTLRFNGVWLNDNMEINKRASTTFAADNTLSQSEAIVDNNGTVYLSAFTPMGSKGFADEMWVLSLPVGESKFAVAALPLANLFAANVFVQADNAMNRVYISGFYADKKDGNYTGILFGWVDMQDKSLHDYKAMPFDNSLRMAGSSNRSKAFNDYTVRQLIVKNDGGFVLLAENYFSTIRTSGYNSGWGYYSMYSYPYMARTIREYFYNDILALSYRADGTRQWHSFIRKQQYSQEDGGMFSSYALMNTGGSLGFLFNDYNSNRPRIQLASIDDGGQVSSQSLPATVDAADWMPRSGKQIAARAIMIPCLRKKQLCFAKIVF